MQLDSNLWSLSIGTTSFGVQGLERQDTYKLISEKDEVVKEIDL